MLKSYIRKQERFIKSEPYCIFGLGVLFFDCFDQLLAIFGRKPDILCDNSPDKWGKEFFGIKCVSPAELSTIGKSTNIIITIKKFEEIYSQLGQLGFQNVFVAVFDKGYDKVSNLLSLSDYKKQTRDENIVINPTDKWTFITGASRGIGKQIAVAMAEKGSNIIAHSRRIENCSELINLCSNLGVGVIPVECELSKESEVEKMLDSIEKEFPPVDFVFNNAAVSLSCGLDQWKISTKDYMIHYMINTIVPIQICYRFIPTMISRGFGRLINISSTIQKRPFEMPYACSKAALSKFVSDIAPSLENTGVMISLVCPGYVRSDMGGINAPNSLESVVPGVLLGALITENVNGRWFIAQDYAGISLAEAMSKAKFYYK